MGRGWARSAGAPPAEELKKKLAALAAKQSPDAATLLEADLYAPLLAWAEDYALRMHGTRAPWAAQAAAAPTEAEAAAETVEMAVDEPDAAADAEAEARRRGKRPLSPAADRCHACE